MGCLASSPDSDERDAGLEPPAVIQRAGAVVLTFRLPDAATGKTPLKTPLKTHLKTAEAILVVLREEPQPYPAHDRQAAQEVGQRREASNSAAS